MNQPTTENWELNDEELALSAQLDAIDTPEETAQAGELETQSDALGAQEIAVCTTVLMKGFEKASQIVLKNPCLTIPAEAIDTIAPKVEAVANKYDITAPEFLAKWREEIELGMTLAGIGYGIYKQHLTIKAQLELQAKAQSQGVEDVKEAA